VQSCQSCGMPMKRDEAGGGTKADGTRTTEYCSHCYQMGRFTDPGITCEQMVTKVKGKMREMHIPGFMGWFFTRNIPQLKRWRA
jgi:hypothetical protein